MNERAIAEQVVIGFEGKQATAELPSFVKGHSVGGVVLFQRNGSEPEELYALSRGLQEASACPLWIAIDHEGGRVQRLKKPFTQFPPMAKLGEVYRRDPVRARTLAYDVGRVMAKELSAVGVHWNFAPVLDVLTNLDCEVIGDRAFGNDPLRVSALGGELIRGLQDHGVMACGKHFPGHGDSAEDSHVRLPVLPHNRRRLDAIELPPFQAAIKAGVASLMTSHILYAGIDPLRPVSLSPIFLRQMLREELGYTGIIVSDDLGMGGLASFGDTAELAVKAIAGGCDVVLLCGADLHQHEQVLTRLYGAVAGGEIPTSIVTESLARIHAAKNHYLSKAPPSDEALDRIGCRAHREVVEAMEEELL